MSVIVKGSCTILLASTFVPSFCPSYVVVEQVYFENPGSSTSSSSGVMPEIPTGTGAPTSASDSTGVGADGGGSSGTSSSDGPEGTITETSSTNESSTSGEVTSDMTGEDTCGGEGCSDESGCSDDGMGEVRYIFVSDKLLPGSFAIDVGASDLCNEEAKAACLPGKYAIWRSDWETAGYEGCLNFLDLNCVAQYLYWWFVEWGSDAPAWGGPSSYQDNVLSEGVYMVPGECQGDGDCVVANGWVDLVDGMLGHPINRTAKGAPVMGAVWSDVYADGGYPRDDDGNPILDLNCNLWTSNMGGHGNIGQISYADGSWTYKAGNTLACNSMARVYCYQMEE